MDNHENSLGYSNPATFNYALINQLIKLNKNLESIAGTLKSMKDEGFMIYDEEEIDNED